MEILRLNERVQVAIEVGESHFREFKSAYAGPPSSKTPRPAADVAKDIAEALVGFANADGGEIIIGVEDDGTVTGHGYSEEQARYLLNSPQTRIHKDTPLASVVATKLTYEDKPILYFSVPKGSAFVHLTSDGRCLQRRDRETVPVAAEAIVFSREETRSREYDRAFVDGAHINDLDLNLVAGIAENLSRGMSIEKCLQYLDLAVYDGQALRLRRAALLLFAKHIQRWHPRVQVRVLKVNGTSLGSGEHFNVIRDTAVTDNIVTLIDHAWDALRPNLAETRLSPNALFQTQVIYPELACRETIVNAIAHRDYSAEGRGIEVAVYLDRMEILSPGALLSSIKIEDLKKLKGVHQSRNAFIARVLREIGYMRELGEGIKRIFELMKQNDLRDPELVSERGSFTVTLRHQFVYTREEKLWLDNFEQFDLTRDQKTVVRLGYSGRIFSPEDVWSAVGIVDTEDYRKLVDSLQRLGILKNTKSKIAIDKEFRNKRTPRKKILRYKIEIPTIHAPPDLAVPQVSDVVADPDDYYPVFVANIPYAIDENKLSQVFAFIGPVDDVVIPINRQTGRQRGFAFVEFASAQAAEKAISMSGEIEIDGRRLYIQRANRRSP